jgi:hypothetical protein
VQVAEAKDDSDEGIEDEGDEEDVGDGVGYARVAVVVVFGEGRGGDGV